MAARKRPTPKDMLSLITEPGIEPMTPITPPVPLADAVFSLRLDEVDEFPDNPRRSRNPQHDNIKTTMRSVGQLNEVDVAMHPETGRYTLVAGGNTRLKVLRELFDETGDDRFSVIRCINKPWTDGISQLIVHLAENDDRGSLTFIDGAIARSKVRAEWNAQLDKPLSDHAFAERLRDAGLSADASTVNLMSYAVERLLPYIPLALEGGMGRPTIRRLRSMEKAALGVLERNDLPVAQFQEDGHWTTLLATHDASSLHPDDLREPLRVKLIDFVEGQVGLGPHGFGWVIEDLDAYLEGREKSLPAPYWRDDCANENANARVDDVSTPPPIDAEVSGPDSGIPTGTLSDSDAATSADTQLENHTIDVEESAAPDPTDPVAQHSDTAQAITRPRQSAPDHRQAVRSAADTLSTMMGPAWREVGEMMSDISLDDDGAAMIAELFNAFIALRSQ